MLQRESEGESERERENERKKKRERKREKKVKIIRFYRLRIIALWSGGGAIESSEF